jgi:hypothetical protein
MIRPASQLSVVPRAAIGAMPSNSEMFERGIHDAEHDELNPFYYQHYYSYRQGYDRARRLVRSGGHPPMAALFGFAVLLALLGLGGWWLFSGWFGAPQAEATAPTVAAATTAPPVSPVLRPTALPAPTLAPLPEPRLAPGVQAVVTNLNGAPLRARRQPGLTPIVARIPEGSSVTLREGPVEADGYTWWRVEAADGVVGWVAQSSPEGLAFLDPLP